MTVSARTLGPRLIGGEMPDWSDDRPGERPPAHGPVLAYLLSLLPAGGRILLAGPHHPSLLDALPDADVTYLLRGQLDAARIAGRPGVRVLCGTLAKLTDVDHYDAVIALDGLGRLCSVEGPQFDWAESLRVLHRALRPGGTLLLAVENELGVHRLVERAAVTSAHTDGGWLPVGEFDPTRPGTPTRLAGRLAAEQLAVSWLGAAWPVPQAPTLIASPGALADPAAPTGALVAAASAAVAAAYAGHPVLSDPRRLAAAAMRAGLGAEFAASWLVVAHRTPRTTRVPALPQVLLGDAPHGPVQELTHGRDGRWVRRTVAPALEPPAQELTTQGPVDASLDVVRRPGLLDGPVPGGRLLEELLLAACLRHDLPTLRRLLTGYTAWLTAADPTGSGAVEPGATEPDATEPDATEPDVAGSGAAESASGTAFATVDNVLLDGGAFAVLDPSWATSTPIEPRTAAARALRRFARLLITGGYAHPWPAATELDALTTMLVAAAGIEPHADLLAAAARLDTSIRSAPFAPVDGMQSISGAEPAAPTIGPDSWREHAELNRRLREQLADATTRARWYESELARRNTELRRAHWQIAAFSGSPGYRLARLGVAVARRGLGAARRLRRLPGRLRRLARTAR